MANVYVSPMARQDIQEIDEYLAEEIKSSAVAKKTVEKIIATIISLENFPQRGTPLATLVNLSTDFRFIPSGAYLIFYRCDDKDVYVIRVLYRRRDYLRILFNEDD